MEFGGLKMDQNKRIKKLEKWVPDKRVSFSEKNINRWAIFGSKNTKVERILSRTDDQGNVIQTCQIGAVGYKGRYWSLSSVHGKMTNVIELLFYRQGMPADNTVRISSVALYDYLADATSLFDEGQRKHRDGNRYRDWIYDTLHILTQVPLMFSHWETKDGSKGIYRMNILKKFTMWGKDLNKDAQWGIITMTLDAEYAEGLRKRNTSPLLIAVENSIHGDNAFAIYRYLRQVLFKTPVYEVKIVDLSKRLSIGSSRLKDLLRDFREACQELIGKEIPSGRILNCEVLKIRGDWKMRVTRGAKERLIPRVDSPDPRRAHEQRMRDMRIEESAYLKRFDELTGNDKERCQARVDEILAGLGGAVKFGPEIHRRNAVIQAMEEFFSSKNNEMVYEICSSKPFMAQEAPGYAGKIKAIQALIAVLREVGKYAP